MALQNFISQEAFGNMISKMDSNLNVPTCPDFSSLVQTTFHDFCIAMATENPEYYVERTHAEAAYAMLAVKLYNTWGEGKGGEGEEMMKKLINQMDDVEGSELELHWTRKANRYGMPVEIATGSILAKLSSKYVPNAASELGLKMDGLSIDEEKAFKEVAEDELDLGFSFGKRSKLYKIMNKPKIREGPAPTAKDLEAEFLALRSESKANVNQKSIANGRGKVYDDVEGGNEDGEDIQMGEN